MMITHTISPQQKRIWTLFGDRMPVNTAIYCITGNINPELMAERLQAAATRHSILNTSIGTGANGSLPLQVVREQHNGPVFKIEYRRMKVADVNTLLPLLSNDPAFCDRDCPLFAALVSSGPDTCYLILQCSPLLLDNWSLNLLVSETVARYHNQDFTPGLPDEEALQYPAYSDWQNENLTLLHTIPVNMLQTLQQMQMPHLPDHAFITSAELHSKHEHSVRENVTTVLQQVLSALQLDEKAAPELLFCVWSLLQYRVSMENVQAVGWTDPCRDLSVVSNTLGVFTKVLPVRMEVAQGDNFLTLFEAVKTQLADIREVKDFFSPGANELQKENVAVTSPACAFEYQHYLAERKHDVNVEQIYAEIATEPAGCKLTVSTNAAGEKIACVTCRGNDGAARAANLLTGFITLLKSVGQHPEKEINQLRIVSDDMLRELHMEAVPAVPTVYSSLVEAVKDHADNHGDRVAVVAGDVHLTYRALDRCADQLAGYLGENYLINKGDIVGWYGAPTDQTMIAFLGILKAGAAYLPLNYLDPAERTSRVISDSGMRLLLTQNESAQPVFSGVGTLCLSDMQWSADNRYVGHLPASDDLAYVIYTSGSTGQPKGVMMEHGAVVNLCAGIRDRVVTVPAAQTLFIAQQAPVFFDASVQQYGVSFFSGDTLFLIGDDIRKNPARLASFLISRAIEIIDFTPGMFEVLLDEVQGNLATLQLKHILVAGESWSPALVRKFTDSTAMAGGVKVSNIYGPTECCVDATYYNITEMPEAGRSLPIGRALPGYSVLLLNDALEPQLPGTPGEIYIGGKGVGRGYLNKEELTGERFLDNPFAAGEKMYKTGDFGVQDEEGLLYFNGRKDNQVKIRGYRIELGEIEKAFLRHSDVEDCIVLLNRQENDVQQLVAFYLSDGKVQPDTLRHYLEQQLPGYMVPNNLVRMDQFPLNSSGKTDRKQLMAHFLKKDKAVKTTLLSEMETTLLNLCRDLLNMNNIGIDDNFFNAGGDSLKAMKLMSYIFKNLDNSIKLRDIFEFPVLSSLARKISVNRNGDPDLIPKVRDAGHYQLSSFQRRFWVLQNLLGEKITNNIQNTYETTDAFDEALLYQALKELTKRQEVLRTIFIQVDEVPFQKILPPDQAAVYLEYRDLRQVSAPEAVLAQVMEEEGKHIFRLDEAPLWRVLVFRPTDDRFVVGITMHHIIADQWSSALFIDQLRQLYHDLLLGIPFRMKELAIQYKDYAEWEQGRIVAGKHASDKAYWSDIFRGDVPALNLRIERPRPRIKGYISHAVSRLFEAHTITKLNEIGRRSDTNVFATLFTIVSVLLYKYTGQQEMIVGFPAINRNRPEVKDLIGFFLNNLAVRCNMNGTDTVEQILSANAKMIIDALEHAGYPYLEMVSELVNDRDLSRAPLFDVFVVYERIESPAHNKMLTGKRSSKKTG
ncbi:amino acid adenylation domain-containing protein [Chitinophaga oryzae]|uniref:Amino acid adenylation domain-containing protein n=1 Tax=Chitinophaga oryzae TaxID=2725414 RepID=A0ABX6LHR4_9BACT|nr:non-ribosomal peptide synthetase [Chitinophaga oryzae]QJB39303.1 amino acid adenylation domain-containing protein [Chitinophaga oryzae]